VFLVIVCADREHPAHQPRISKPPITSAEEFLNRQAEVFIWSNYIVVEANDSNT